MAITGTSLRYKNDLARATAVNVANTSNPNLDKRIELKPYDPFTALIDSMSASWHDLETQLVQLFDEQNENNLQNYFLEALPTSLTRGVATQSSGNVTFTGSVGSIVPEGTEIETSEGLIFTTNTSGTISLKNINITSITRLENIVTVQTEEPHLLTQSTLCSITGSNQTEYNIVNQLVAITGSNTFQFEVSGNPTTPATGNIVLSYNGVTIKCTSQAFGKNTNISRTTLMQLTSPILGVDDELYPAFEGFVGGADEESLGNFLLRKKTVFQNNGVSLDDYLIDKLQYAGLTRVFVRRATPQAGFVTIYPFFDEQENSLATNEQLELVKETALLYTISTIPNSNVIVENLQTKVIDFSFSSLSPNTISMQNAILQNLVAFFSTNNLPGYLYENNLLRVNVLKSVIETAIDENGNSPSFALNTPFFDIFLQNNETPVLGNVLF